MFFKVHRKCTQRHEINNGFRQQLSERLKLLGRMVIGNLILNGWMSGNELNPLIHSASPQRGQHQTLCVILKDSRKDSPCPGDSYLNKFKYA